MNYLDLANSSLMFFMCAIPVAIITYQAVKLLMMAYKQGLSIGMSKEDLNKCIKTSASISVLPALSLVTLLIALAPSLGKFFPWLRLTNIGSGAYEPMAAELALQTIGAGAFSALTPAGLMTVYMTMNLGMCIAPVVTLVFLKSYDRKLRKSKATNPFIVIGTGAAFLGIIARLSVPYYVNFPAKLPFISVITGTLAMLVCYFLGKKITLLRDFGLSLSIVAGVIVCILAVQAGLV